MLHNFTRSLELSDRLETQYLRVLYYDLAKNYTGSYSSYEYTRLCTIVEGEKHISVNKSDSFSYGKNEFLLLPPQSHVKMSMYQHTRALVFELSDALIEDVATHISNRGDFDYNLLIKEHVLCAEESVEFRDVYNKIMKLLADGGDEKKYILDLLSKEMVYYLLQTKGAQQLLSTVPKSPVNRAIHLMEETYASNVSIQQIAGELGMSEASFSQYFKKITGQNPKAFLTELRMEKARELIGQSSVTDTAMELGYDNISHFIALFKSHFGVTPGQYKKEKN